MNRERVEGERDPAPEFPGIPAAMDGTSAVVAAETMASEAAGAYPITPSTNMGEGFAAAYAQGRPNAFGRRLIFFEPEGEHAAAGVTAGLSMVGLRSANFSSGQGIAYMHESLYAATGKRLTYVLNIACRAMTKQALNIHAGHDDYHAIDDSGFFQLLAKDGQGAADLNLIAHRIAELALNPGVCAMDGFLTSHVIETLRVPEPELVRRFLGDPADVIACPTPAQRLMFGPTRRRIPELFDMDAPAMLGTVQNQDAYAQGVAAQRPFFFDHIADLTDLAMEEYRALTGRQYRRASGYRLGDAEYVLVGQGSIVANMEALVDWLRDVRGVPIGVLDVTMFRPFPADLVSRLLAGRRAVTVLERTDQPLAVDLPLVRELRATIGQALENGRARNGRIPFEGVEPYSPSDAPDIHSGVFGLGSRDTQPGDVLAAVANMLPDGAGRRRFYLGIDFVRAASRVAGITRSQDEVLKAYPHVGDLALQRAENVDLMPEGALSLRIHSVGGWGAITTGKNLAVTLFELLGLHVKANPKYGSEKKGQPTTFYATFARQPVRLDCELSRVHVVLSPDANVFGHSDPLAGLVDGGVLVIQWDASSEDLWRMMPARARRAIRERNLRVFHVDGFAIARAEASDVELQYRMQGAAFQGAFFKASPLMEREGLSEEALFEAIRAQLQKKFGHKGDTVVDDNLRVIRRGYDELVALDVASMPEVEARGTGARPRSRHFPLAGGCGPTAIADRGRFYDEIGDAYQEGEEPIADPFAALSAMPAATSALRDMTGIRFEVPKLLPDKCTGCGQCWIQCPDSAIPGVVSELRDLVALGVGETGTNGSAPVHLPDLLEPLTDAVREVLREPEFTTFDHAFREAGARVAARLDEKERPAVLAEVERVATTIADLPVTRARPFFDLFERKEPGSGGLLSVTVDPETCKGCMLCVDVCPEDALVVEKQTPDVVDALRRGWRLWEALPDTPDRFVQVRDLDQGIGVLGTLLLKKDIYGSMCGGDGACMGCGEKTVMHLVTSAIEATMRPRVAAFVERLRGLVRRLDDKARLLLAASADLDHLPDDAPVQLEVSAENRAHLRRVRRLLTQLRDLLARYDKGRANLAISNATGCSSVWGSSWPYNPYPYPWVNHLFQDAPSVAIGIFEGFMRKMADGFRAVRLAELEVEGGYQPDVHDRQLAGFGWRDFTDDEFRLCPPILAVGGDGAMMDIGFQNLSRLLASGKPIRAIMLDTQVYSNTGGQACTSGFTGQISDMAVYGRAVHGKAEARKELSLLGIAHRGAYVLQSSQSSASHLLAGVLRGLGSRRPTLFCLHAPCMPEHGIPDDAAWRQAKLAVEARAIPLLVYDPDAGADLAECLDLSGNPALNETWPTQRIAWRDEAGVDHEMEIPLTTADWAATEGRFARHFAPIRREEWAEDQVPVHAYLDLSPEERGGRRPFVWAVGADRRLDRVGVSPEMIELTEDRIAFWHHLKEMAGLDVPDVVRDAVRGELEDAFAREADALRTAHEAALKDLRDDYATAVARRMAETLLGAPGPVASAPARPAAPSPTKATPPAAVAAPPSPATAAPEGDEEALEEGPWIEGELCTACDECTNLNGRMFAYDDSRRAYIKDPRAGTFQELVLAAERCAAEAIHPGRPLDPRERDLEKWIDRAEPFT